MKTKLTLWALAVGLFLSAAGWMHAQDTSSGQQTTTTTSDNTTNTHANVRTLTGCLQKGEGSKEYELMGDDGSTWEVRSDGVDLGSHVGQTVTLTGAVKNAAAHGMKEDMKQEAQEHGMDKSATEHGHMTVTNVTTVNGSCSK